MSKHTPSPWIVNERFPGSYNIDGPDIWLGASSAKTKEQNLADAFLVSAAPEMLEALELASALFGWIDDAVIDAAHRRSAIKMANDKRPEAYIREIIRKAKGEA